MDFLPDPLLHPVLAGLAAGSLLFGAASRRAKSAAGQPRQRLRVPKERHRQIVQRLESAGQRVVLNRTE